jgi:sugar O-acyltransferase (sialic acid O-acetyltransferase NeuD family)
MKKVLILGAGSLAKEFECWSSGYLDIVGFVGGTNDHVPPSFVCPNKYFNDENIYDQNTRSLIMAIADPSLKEILYKKYTQQGFTFENFIHPSAVIAKTAVIGAGVVISPNVVISANVVLSTLVYINYGCGVGHDAFIGAYTQVNPGVQISGYVKIGNKSTLGAGVTVLPNIEVGNLASIGAGSTVVGNVSPESTVFGNPARKILIDKS